MGMPFSFPEAVDAVAAQVVAVSDLLLASYHLLLLIRKISL